MQHSIAFGLLEVLPEILPIVNTDPKPCIYQGAYQTHYIWILNAII